MSCRTHVRGGVVRRGVCASQRVAARAGARASVTLEAISQKMVAFHNSRKEWREISRLRQERGPGRRVKEKGSMSFISYLAATVFRISDDEVNLLLSPPSFRAGPPMRILRPTLLTHKPNRTRTCLALTFSLPLPSPSPSPPFRATSHSLGRFRTVSGAFVL